MLFSEMRLSLCFVKIFSEHSLALTSKNMQTGPNPHPRVIKCWGFPSTKSYPSCDGTKMTMRVLQTPPQVAEEEYGPPRLFFGLYDTQESENGEVKMFSCRWRGISVKSVPSGHFPKFYRCSQLDGPPATPYKPWALTWVAAVLRKNLFLTGLPR